MMARRGATSLSGIMAIDKPSGMTSHDVVSVVRRVTGEKRVGHAGTLDPMATGVLVVLVGPATRLTPYFTSERKGYDARILFGEETNTDDAEGVVTRTHEVPSNLRTEIGAIAHVADLVGTHEQIPPDFSAIKKGGVTAHRAARAGEQLVLEPREIEIVDATLLGVEPEDPVAWNISLVVSKGTYVRAIARDLGRQLGTAAHLGSLRRTSSGTVDIHQCHALDTVAECTSESITSLFVPAASIIGIPTFPLSESDYASVQVGRKFVAEGSNTENIADGSIALTYEGRLCAVYTKRDSAFSPATVIPGGVT